MGKGSDETGFLIKVSYKPFDLHVSSSFFAQSSFIAPLQACLSEEEPEARVFAQEFCCLATSFPKPFPCPLPMSIDFPEFERSASA